MLYVCCVCIQKMCVCTVCLWEFLCMFVCVREILERSLTGCWNQTFLYIIILIILTIVNNYCYYVLVSVHFLLSFKKETLKRLQFCTISTF